MSPGHYPPEALQHYLEVLHHLDAENCPACEEAIRRLLGAGDIQAALRLGAALDPAAALPAEDTLPGLVSVPGYELLEELGRGGMGVVYKARQLRPDRVVALKMILHAGHAGDDGLRRFQADAQILASLQHPNIVPVYEVGEHDGLPFFSLEFCDGGSLDDQLDGTPWEAKPAAGLVETLARAMQHAHQAQVIHRDLKPANILLQNRTRMNADCADLRGSEEGPSVIRENPSNPRSSASHCLPKITDFGLARKLDQHGQTHTGAILGTPAYMAPEQARGQKEVGPAADVYALGAILYELLTGRPPFVGATVGDTLAQVCSQEPVPPRRLQPGVPRDLDTICLKCLEKEAHRRYGSAAALAEDLRRFGAGEPIAARPVGALGRSVKWARRRPAVAALLALVAGVAAAGLGGIAWAYRQAGHYRDRVGNLLQETEEQNSLARSWQLASAAVERLPFDPELSVLLAAEAARLRPTPQAEDALRQALFGTFARGTLCRDDRRVHDAAFDPAGRRVVTAHADGAARLWDAATLRQIASLRGHRGPVTAAAFSPDGRWVLTAGDGAARVWDAATGKCLKKLEAGGLLRGAAFSPSGKLVVTAGADGFARIWEVETEKELWARRGGRGQLFGAAFGPDDARVVTAGADGTARVWEWKAKPTEAIVLGRGSRPVYAAGFSPDGRHVVTANWDATARVWDVARRQEVAVLESHTARVTAAAFSRDGRLIVTASRDTTARVWDTRGKLLRVLVGHQEGVLNAAFDPEGKSVVTASIDGTARLWEARPERVRIALPARDGGAASAAFSPDGRLVVTAGEANAVRVWEAAGGQARDPVIHHEGRLYAVACHPEGFILTAGKDCSARVWAWPADVSKPFRTLSGHQGAVRGARFDPGGERAVTASADGSAIVWNWRAEKSLAVLAGPHGHQGVVHDAAFSPDGRLVVTAGADGTARVWDWQADPLHPLAVLHGHVSAVYGAAFSPDGRLVVTAGDDRIALVWEWQANPRRPRTILRGHNRLVSSAAFHGHNSRFVVTASWDGTARVWDPDLGHTLTVLPGDDDGVNLAVFSPDGRSVLTAGDNGTVQVCAFEGGGALEDLLALARRVSRDFTPQERKQYLGEVLPGR